MAVARVRAIDLERPVQRPSCWSAATYARAEGGGTSATYVLKNERYNNQARIINRQRCHNLGNFANPPNGMVKLISIMTGKPSSVAPYRMQSLAAKTPAQWAQVGVFYGFQWNINLAPAVVTLPPYTTLPDAYTDYRAFMGVS